MDYMYHDELIIMLPLAIMKKVTSGQSVNDLCFFQVLILKLVRSHRRSNVAQWSLDDLCAIASAAHTIY